MAAFSSVGSARLHGDGDRRFDFALSHPPLF
jgi:hypothetical protein